LGQHDPARRANSALLAVIAGAPEVGRAVLAPLGAPAGTITSFIDVPFERDGRRVVVDGVVRVTTDDTTWTALVCVASGCDVLEPDRSATYRAIVRTYGFDALVMVSNDGSKAGEPAAHNEVHWTWTNLIAAAARCSDLLRDQSPEYAWLIDEVVHFLNDPASGVLEPAEQAQQEQPPLRAFVTKASRVFATVRRRAASLAVSTAGVTWMAAAFAFMLVENRNPERDISFGDGLWWSLSTITTVGYGDIYPLTPAGRIVAGITMFVGISTFAIVTARMADRLRQSAAGTNRNEPDSSSTGSTSSPSRTV